MLKTVLAAALLLSNAYVHAQTADEIINKHINAIGGKEVISKIKSQVAESELLVMGSTLPSKSYMLAGKGFRSEADFNGQVIIQCITPTGGWMINPLTGSSDPQPMPDEQVKAAQSVLEPGGDLYNYKEKGSKAELAGKDSVEGVHAFKVKLTNKDNKEVFYFFDAATYYVIKRETTVNVNGESVTTFDLYSNHKKTDFGYVMPFTTFSQQGFEITVNITKVEFNKEIDPKLFETPK